MRITSRASFGAGSASMPIHLDNVECIGSENSITECPHRPWGVENCGHSEDAGVVCGKIIKLCYCCYYHIFAVLILMCEIITLYSF